MSHSDDLLSENALAVAAYLLTLKPGELFNLRNDDVGRAIGRSGRTACSALRELEVRGVIRKEWWTPSPMSGLPTGRTIVVNGEHPALAAGPRPDGRSKESRRARADAAAAGQDVTE